MTVGIAHRPRVPDADGKVASLSRLHWRRWGDEWVVFNSASGQTHKLDTLSAVLLLICEDENRLLVELPSLIADRLSLDNDSNLADLVARIVEQCVGLGLLAHVEE